MRFLRIKKPWRVRKNQYLRGVENDMHSLRKRISSKEQRRNASEDMLIGMQEDPDQGA